MDETNWQLVAAQRGIDNEIMERALREIDEYRPPSDADDPYIHIAGYAMRRTREALAELAESRS